jgi:hypothetical protein
MIKRESPTASKAAKPKAKTARKATKPKPAPTVRMKSAEGLNGEQITEPKLTLKQERFCQAYIECQGNASEAYRRAYDAERMKDKQIWEEACKLLKTPKVSQRVAQLKAQHRERHEITVDDLVAELEEARAIAMKIESPSAMVSASLGKGKLLGLIVDKGELTGKGGEKLMPEGASTRDIARAVLSLISEAKIEAGEGDEDDHVNGVDLNGAYAHAEPDEPVRTFDPTGSRLD